MADLQDGQPDEVPNSMQFSTTHWSLVLAAGRTLVSGSNDHTVRLWNLATRRELMQMDSGNVQFGRVTSLEFSPTERNCWRAGAARRSGPLLPVAGKRRIAPPGNSKPCSTHRSTSKVPSGCTPKTSGCTRHWQNSILRTRVSQWLWRPLVPTGTHLVIAGPRRLRSSIGSSNSIPTHRTTG